MASMVDLQQLEKSASEMKPSPEVDRQYLKKLFEAENLNFSRFLLEEDIDLLPKGFAENFWVAFDKELALTNLNDIDVQAILERIDLVRLDTIMQTPDFRLNWDAIKHLDQLGIKTFVKAKRSTGGINRERAMLASEVKQFLTNEIEGVKGGFLSKIAGFVKGRK